MHQFIKINNKQKQLSSKSKLEQNKLMKQQLKNKTINQKERIFIFNQQKGVKSACPKQPKYIKIKNNQSTL